MALYCSHVNRISAMLGDMPLSKIKRPHVQRFVSGLCLAPATTRTCYAVLSMLLKDAVESELIAVSPCRNISLPAKQPRPVEPLSPAEVERVISEMTARYQIAAWLAMCAGLRLSETLGLTVDRNTWLPHGAIRVDRQLGSEGSSPRRRSRAATG